MMLPRFLLAPIALITICSAASSQPDWRRDSVWCDTGVPVTPEFEPDTRFYFSGYDEKGRPSEVTFTRLNESGTWENLRRRQMTYDSDNLTSLLIQGWNANTQQWVDRTFRRLTYDSEGRISERLVQLAETPGAPLENSERWKYSYLPGGDEAQILYQQWDKGTWQDKRRQLFTYNAQGEPDTQTLEVWNEAGSTWTGLFRRMWAYGPNGLNPAEITTQRWNNSGNAWNNVSRRLFFYNNAGFWLGTTFQEWDGDAGIWTNQSREFHLINAQNAMDNLLLQRWDGNQWTSVVRETTRMDGYEVNTVAEQLNTFTGTWERVTRYGTLFSPEGRVLEEIRNQIWEPGTQEWLNDSTTQRYTHYWSSTIVRAREITEAPAICKVPNPYQPGTPIMCESALPDQSLDIRLYDLLGRQVYQGETGFPRAFSLDVALPAGTYLLHLSQGDKLRQTQLLVLSN